MILDAGCGNIPRGDVNCDLLIPDSRRGWDLDPHGIPNFVKADVRFLPFRSRIFDHVNCSHVIEHLEDPDEGIQELKRVSRKTVAVIVPHAFLSALLDPFFQLHKYPEWRRWLKKNHLHYWNNDPFKTGSWKLSWSRYPRSRRNKLKMILSWLIPMQTLTVFEVD